MGRGPTAKDFEHAPVGVGQGHDVEVKVVHQEPVLGRPVVLDQLVDEVVDRGGADPLPSVDSAVDKDGRLPAARWGRTADLHDVQGPAFVSLAYFNEAGLVLVLVGHTLQVLVDAVAVKVSLKVHPGVVGAETLMRRRRSTGKKSWQKIENLM